MKRMLVGVDGSAAGFAAIRWSAGIAVATGSKFTAVHAFRRPYAEIGVEDLDRMLEERHAIVDRWLEPAVEAGATVRTEVIEGDPRMVLTDLAQREQADLLVVGRSGQGGAPGLLHIGSVVEHIAHEAARPLAVIPVEVGETIDRIVVGVDGSASSSAAVSWVAELAPLVGAEVVAVLVEEPILEWTPTWDDRNWRRDAVRELETWTAPIKAAGVDLDLVPVENLYPADGLMGLAAGRGADLLVVGTRGTGGFLGLRFGGVAMKLLHRASLPLVMVPPVETS
jgi:nucleotide-binding universal stress UspA family protein